MESHVPVIEEAAAFHRPLQTAVALAASQLAQFYLAEHLAFPQEQGEFQKGARPSLWRL